jgi:hypothetical protein
LVWRENPGGEVRSLAEAIEIARRHGVVIPDDVQFVIDTIGDLGPEVTARGPLVRLPDGEAVTWSDLVHPRMGKVPFRLWSGILKSDEAIVAVLGHEMFELELARPFLIEGGVPVALFIERTSPGVPGNWHDQAWDVADRLVERMRKEQS